MWVCVRAMGFVGGSESVNNECRERGTTSWGLLVCSFIFFQFANSVCLFLLRFYRYFWMLFFFLSLFVRLWKFLVCCVRLRFLLCLFVFFFVRETHPNGALWSRDVVSQSSIANRRHECTLPTQEASQQKKKCRVISKAHGASKGSAQKTDTEETNQTAKGMMCMHRGGRGRTGD